MCHGSYDSSFLTREDRMSTDKKIDYILRTVEERDVRYLRLCFTDVLG